MDTSSKIWQEVMKKKESWKGIPHKTGKYEKSRKNTKYIIELNHIEFNILFAVTEFWQFK